MVCLLKYYMKFLGNFHLLQHTTDLGILQDKFEKPWPLTIKKGLILFMRLAIMQAENKHKNTGGFYYG